MQPSSYYHIYNHANGKDNIFIESRNYPYFLSKWKNYIMPIADTYAYCLMPNHFHFLIKIHDQDIIQDLLIRSKLHINKQSLDKLTGHELEKVFSNYISQQFSNLFNGYTKAINKSYKRYGSLFAPNFKRKPIVDESHLYNVLAYIHLNPVFHGFENNIEDYPYSSIDNYKVSDSWINTTLLIQKFKTYSSFINWQNTYFINKNTKD